MIEMISFFRKHWCYVGLVVAIVVVGCLVANFGEMSEIKVLLALSFVAILVHQFEEYRWPGYFAGLFNVVIFKSDIPDRYPLNTQSAMVINILIAYVFYLLPVFFPNIIWLGLAPILMGFFQFIWHGIFANIKAKTIYNPGLGAVVLLHVPIGYAYMRYVLLHNLATNLDWILGLIYFLVATYFLIIKGNMLLKSKETNHYFSKKQLGPYNDALK
ncbi:HXXEE domain-containing protein [Bacillus toyonensis]|uniref:HXXEE domain-containing protein n=1 Tax=Bacillus toyonensis TaxID=155322 RepID=UPI000BF94E8B|nr:HXXEE domain-containing protein [Bacillus toyonensis]PEP71826.1 HXXEE domain-containing protein [Bacillus toyonensis]